MTMSILAWLIAIPALGLMTGLRSMAPMAVLCWFAYRGTLDVDGTWASFTQKKVTLIVFAVLALGELIGDKLPRTPNRTAPFPLLARIAFGGLVGALAATALSGSAIEGGLLGAISAVGGAFLGYHLRYSLVNTHDQPDIVVALVEDAIVIGCSIMAMGVLTG